MITISDQKELTDIEIGYIAGLIDGEAAFILRVSKHRKYGNYVRTQVRIDSVDVEHLSFLKTKLGGSLLGPYQNREEWSPFHVWVLTSPMEIRNLLLRVYPHLLVKKDQAKIILEWFSIRGNRAGKRGSKIPSDELELIARLRKLARKGKRI